MFAIVTTSGEYYKGAEFCKSVVDATLFETRREAEKRTRLRSDLRVIEVERAYRPELTRALCTVGYAIALLFVLATGAKAQTFQQVFNTPTITSQNVIGVGSGDFRNVGYADLVVLTTSQVCVYQNNGAGVFNTASPTCLSLGSWTVQGLVVGDFKSDGHLGFAIIGLGQQSYNAYSFYNGDGTGNFTGGGLTYLSDVNGNQFDGPSTAVAGPFAASFSSNTTPGIAIGVQHGNSTFTAIGSEANSTAIGSVAITGRMVGAIGSTGYIQTVGAQTGYTFAQNNAGGINFSSFTFCGDTTFVSGGYLVGYKADGGSCVQGPDGSTLGSNIFTLTGSETVQSVIPLAVNLGGNPQSGLVALLQNGSLAAIYGASLETLNTQINIAGVSNPTFGVSDVFRPSGVPEQDFIVLNSAGLTEYAQVYSGSFDASLYAFPAQAIGTQGTKTFTFTNTGTGAITPVSISMSGSPDFTETNTCPTAVAFGAQCQVTVAFIPGTVESSSAATLSLTSALVTQSISLTGTEILFSKPEPAQTSLTFTNQLINTTSPTQSIEIYNGGNEAFTMTVAVAAPFYQTNNCVNVQPSTNCQLVFSFEPTAAGLQNGTANLTFDTASGESISLTGTGVTAPSITTPPTPQSVVLGQTVTFSVVAGGTAPFTYQWYVNAGNGATAITGATSASYSFTPAAGSINGAVYTVTIKNAYGSATTTGVNLTILFPPAITTQPTPQTAIFGNTVNFSTVATGSGTLAYTWTKNNTIIGGNTPTLTFTPSQSDNGAQIAVTVTNLYGTTNSNAATLTLDFPPSITTQPASQTVVLSSPTGTVNATFSVVGSGTGVAYQWLHNGASVSGATASSYVFQASASNNGDTFQVKVSDPYGATVSSNVVTLTVGIPPTATATQSTVNVVANGTTSLAITDTGTAPLTVAWSAPGCSGLTCSVTVGATGAVLKFTATVTNQYGTATANFNVNVLTPPTITSLTQLAGSPSLGFTTLTVVATENLVPSIDGVLQYAWTASGKPVAGCGNATTCEVPTPSGSTTVTYTITVTDNAGPTAQNIVVGYVPPPQILMTLSPATQTITAGQSATFTGSISNANGAVTLSCSYSGPGTCTLNPTQLSANNSAFTATISTPASSSLPLTTFWWLGALLAALGAIICRPRYRRLVLATAATCILLIALGGCAAGGSAPKTTPTPPTPKPPAPTSTSYTVKVYGVNTNGQQANASATLVIQ